MLLPQNGLKQLFEKVLLINSIRTYRNLLSHFIFDYLLVIEDYEQAALQKKLIFAV